MSDTSPVADSDNITQVLINWINTDTWEQSQEMLKAHTDLLLSDKMLEALDTLLAESADDGERRRVILQTHRTILEKARSDSIDAAYADLLKPSQLAVIPQGISDELRDAIQALVAADSSAEVMEQIEQHPILLTPQARTAIDTLLDGLRQAGQQNAVNHIAQRYATLKEVIEAIRDPLNLAFNALLGAAPGKLHQVIAQHPALLDNGTLEAFDQLATRAEQAGDAVLAQRIHLRLNEVRRILREDEQVTHRSRPAEMDYAELDRMNMIAERDSMTIGINRGSITQTNIDRLDVSLPSKKWQAPAAPSLPKRFIGRQKQLQQLCDYLIAGEGVIISGTPIAMTLQGMAGIGKTYLATQVARDVQTHFPGGVISILLGERITGEKEAQAPLHELAGYAFEGHTLRFVEQLQPQQVAAWLQGTAPGPLLVIFDDVWSQDALLFLERALPEGAVRIVTTRDATIAQALSGKKISLDRLTIEDGVALLEDRLECQMNAELRSTLEKLVTLLEGHALALEIIAARIQKPQRLQGILGDLERGVGQGLLDQLQLREQTRQTSLEKSLAVSYEYMSHEEQRRFRMLGVFGAETPITLEAVATIWGIDDLTVARQKLFDLVDLAMLEETENAYRQHGLLRVYAYALLEREDEMNGARWVHAEYYRSLALRAETATPKDYPLLDLHMQNLLSALEWTDEHEHLLFSQLVEILFQFLQLRGQSEKLEKYLPKAIAIADATGHPGRQANVLRSLGDLERRLGNIDQARAHYDTALPLYRLERDQLGEANVYMSLADIFLAQKQWAQAKAHYEQALPLFVAERDPLGQANTLIDLGLARFELGDHEQGMSDVQQSAALFRNVGDEVWARRAELRLAELRTRHEQPEVDTALFEAFINVRSSQEMFQRVQQYPQLLTDEWFAAVEALIASQEDEQTKAVFSERLDTLKEIRQTLEQHAVEVSKATDLVVDFARADWSTRHQMLTEHTDVLLSEAVEPLFDALLTINEDEVRHALEKVRTLLRRCRTWGIDPVFYFELYMRLGDDIDIPAQYEAPLMQLATLLARRSQDEAALEQAVKQMETILNRLTADAPPLFEAALLRDLAEAMQALPTNHPLRNLNSIAMYYQEALPIYQTVDRPISVAFIQRSIGDALSEQGQYAEALKLLHAAAEGLQAQEHTRDDAAWALSSYAGALDNLGRTDEALAAYTQAIALLPDMPLLLRNRAETWIHARHLNEAEADLARAVELDGNEDSSYLWRRRAQIAIAQGNGLQAAQLLDEVLKRDPSHDVLFLLAQNTWLQGDLQTARERLRRAFGEVNAGEQAAMRRELKLLLAEHPELPKFAETDFL